MDDSSANENPMVVITLKQSINPTVIKFSTLQNLQ